MRTRCFWFCEKVELQKEIERLRGVVKNLMDDGPGTPLGRLEAIAKAAIDRGLCVGLEAKPAELFLIEAYDRLANPSRCVGVSDQPMSEDYHWGGNDGKAPVHPK